ncbi:MAG: response regulator [Acidobacteria bacterium]|nr:response regulator [Acidobacteriota bacterium]
MTWSTSSTVGAASADVLPELGSILLVEDEPDLADLVSSRLRTENFAVAVASSVSSALHSLKGISFDLVLLDVHLPDGSGLEVLQSLATDPDAPRVVLMTGSGTSETVLDAIRYRAQEFIRKPFTLDELVEVVGRSVKAAREEIEVISCTPEWLEVLASCTRESAARIEAFVSHLASDLSTDVRIQIGQVFRELLLNAVEWGGGLNPNHRVRVAYVRGKRSIQYRIADPGLGFSFRELAHSALSATTDDPLSYVRVRERQGIRPGGLGILMARAMADELIYNEQQNEVLFIKYL